MPNDVMGDTGGSTTISTRSDRAVLIVDDLAGMRRMIAQLVQTRGYQTHQAADGAEALEILGSHHVDVVVTDLRMPGISGEELLAEVKLQFPETPVIVITGQPVVDSAVECIKGGAVDYISKPFKPQHLLKAIDAAIRSRGARPRSERKRTVVGRYVVEKLLGEGTMGIVYRGYSKDDPDRKSVAVKVLKFLSSETDPDQKLVLKRFMQTAEGAKTVNHPNVVDIFEYGYVEEEDLAYLVMEYLTGRTLKRLIADPAALDLTRRVTILRDAAIGLDAIHVAGLVHRDVKPDNIMVDDDFRVKLTDFSIARIPNSDLTLTNNVMGSPAYLSPEAFASPRIDYRADIFSLGVVAYEMLVGQRPFSGDSLARFAQTIPAEKPPRPTRLDPSLPAALELVLARMLKKDKRARYQSAAQVAEDLQSFLDTAAVHHCQPTLLQRFLGCFHEPDWA